MTTCSFESCEKDDDLMGVGNPPTKWFCSDHYNEGIREAFVPARMALDALEKYFGNPAHSGQKKIVVECFCKTTWNYPQDQVDWLCEGKGGCRKKKAAAQGERTETDG